MYRVLFLSLFHTSWGDQTEGAMAEMNRMSPNGKRFWVASWIVLCVIFAVTLGGLYKFYRVASQIYEQNDAPRTSQTGHRALDRGWQESLRDLNAGQETPGKPSVSNVKTQESQKPIDEKKPKAGSRELPAKHQKVETFLLIGVDSRVKFEQARADTIVLAAVPESGGDITLLSIPRDTYVHVAGHGYTKINHAMSWGGLPLLKRTVQEFLGVKVDHSVVADFDGFRKVVDEIGGLELTAEKDMHYDDPTDGTSIHLHKGQKLSNGKLALDYARFRNDPEADAGRMRRQQQVIRAMIQQGGKPDNWARMLRLADIIGEHVQTDVPPGEWVRLLMAYAYYRPEQVKTLKLNGINRISDQDQLWYFFVDDAEKKRVSRELEQLRRGKA
jgi:LCP family protein required for cell wall assembly